MSVGNDSSRVQYEGNGSTETEYVIPFAFFDAEDLRVAVMDAAGTVQELALGTDFAVTGAGDPEGGSLTTSAAWDGTHTVTIYREVPLTQDTAYVENADFPAKSHERALDKLTMICQQLGRRFSAAFRFRESDGEAAPMARIMNSLFGLDASGDPLFRTADEVKAWLSLAAPILNYPTKVWVDDAERALAVPDFEGQVGAQTDTSVLYVSSGLTAGAWQAVLGNGSIVTAMLANDVLSADVTGLAKMEDGFLAASTAGRAKMADSFITLAKIGGGIFTADAAGRGKFAAGFMDGGLCASGLWRDVAPAGAVIQTVLVTSFTPSSTTSLIPCDSSIPQIGEGVQILSAQITPTSTANKIRIRAFGHIVNSTATAAAVFRVGIPDALAAQIMETTTYVAPGVIVTDDAPASLSPQTYLLSVGSNSGTGYINQGYANHTLGGKIGSYLFLEEIKA